MILTTFNISKATDEEVFTACNLIHMLKQAVSSESLLIEVVTGQEDADERPEISYLRLRYEMLPAQGFKIPSFPPLDEIYNKMRKGKLAQQDIDFVGRLLVKLSNSLSKLSIENLRACNESIIWIKAGLNRVSQEQQDFLSKMLEILKLNLHLTSSQVEGINKWLRMMKGIPELNPLAFAGNKDQENKEG